MTGGKIWLPPCKHLQEGVHTYCMVATIIFAVHPRSRLHIQCHNNHICVVKFHIGTGKFEVTCDRMQKVMHTMRFIALPWECTCEV